MSDISSLLDKLSPEKRKLLELQLKKKEAAVKTYPLSYAQRRLWFLDQFEPESPYYNIPMALRIKGNFSIDVFKKTIQSIINRHEALRTTFIARNGEPLQAVKPLLTIPVEVQDISSIPADTRENKIIELATADAQKPFNLEKGPLIRVSILKTAQSEHIVLLNMHHIISDGWSIGVLVAEITQLYSAITSGKESPLPKLKIQYPDYAIWQKKYLEGEVFEKQLSFWKEYLGSTPPVLELPMDRSRPAVQTNAGSSLIFSITKEITEGLNQLGRENNATMFMVLIAAIKVLLFRLSGQSEISIGTPIANRTRGETEALIGLFINTIVLYSNLDEDISFTELLGQVRKNTLQTYENQDLPFEYIVDALEPSRNMSVSPLFQVMFILQNTPSKAQQVADLTMEMIPVDMGTSTFDLTFSMSESEAGLHLSVEYNTDLFNKNTVERFVHSLETILKNIVAEPEQSISELFLLEADERQEILTAWNDTSRQLAPDKCLHKLFEEQVDKTPGQLALVVPQGSSQSTLTYAELNSNSNQIAHYMLKKGVQDESIIGICIERSEAMIAGLLGILKAGCSYLPIEPNYPDDRVEYMLKDSGVHIVLTSKSLVSRFENKDVTTILLDDDWTEIAKENDTNPLLSIQTDQLAYIIYTSGSTGKPKGVEIQHNQVVNYIAYAGELFELSTRDRVLQFASISFDAAAEEIYPALCSGAALVLRNDEMISSVQTFCQATENLAITVWDLPTAYWHQIVTEAKSTGFSLPQKLKLVIIGGEKSNTEHILFWQKQFATQVRLLNTYGPTECSVVATFWELPADSGFKLTSREVPIGKPVANAQAYVLDKKLNPVPLGVAGELHIGGLGVARGYHNRPGLTAEKFIANPFHPENNNRLYRTGDLVRMLPDGNIEFVGRIDDQVKIRGFRIELGEIENIFLQHKSIKDVTVIAQEDSAVGNRLVAYLVPQNGPVDNKHIRTFLKQQLPDYMIPSVFVHLEALPLTPNGKVNRKALPLPDQEQIIEEMSRTYVAPSSPTEELLANIWSELLNIQKIGILDNFFDIGGHSLIATQLVSRIRDAFDLEVPLRELFLAPTIKELGRLIEHYEAGDVSSDAIEISKVAKDDDLPLSFAQQRLWFLDQMEPDSPFYNIPDIFKLHGPLQPEYFEQSINKIIERHAILRTTIHTVEGKGVQRILPQMKIQIPLTDFSTHSEPEKKALALARKNLTQPFKLAEAPLFRVELYKLHPNEHIIIFVIHHIISDNWSSQVLVRELITIYDSLVADRPHPLPELPFQYADFSVWQRNWLSGEVLNKQLNYWKEHLASVPPVLELPFDRPRPSMQTYNGSYITFKYNTSTTRQLKAIAKEEGATLFITLMAAFQIFLSRYSGQTNISVGTPIANRNRSELEQLIGFFVNTLVMHTNLSGKPTFREAIHRAKEVALGAYAHQDIPFEKLVDTIQPQRDMSHSPLFQVMFSMQNIPSDVKTHSDLSLSPVEVDSKTAKFDLTLFISEREDNLGAALEYNTDLFDLDTIERMVDHFNNLISGMLENPDMPVSDITMISGDETYRMLNTWNGEDKEAIFSEPVQKILEIQAEKHPQNIAVRFENNRLTYEALNGLANQFAHHLISKGIRTDELVGLSIERGVDMVVAIFGILKAGAAYVPIDPSYPKSRLEYILHDSGIKILVTMEQLLDILPTSGAEIVCMDRDRKEINRQEIDNPQLSADVENLAYMIYTSGSTGKPKGTLINHRGLINYLNWCYEAYPVEQGEGSLVHATIAFDATVSALFTPILAAKTINILPETEDLEALSRDLLSGKNYSLIKITPAHLSLLSSQIPANEADKLTKALVIGGENLTSDQIEFWQENAPSTLLFNEYGPTETVVGCVVYEALKWTGSGSVPIGHAIRNTKIYVLDEHLAPVPIGIPGELYIGGEGLARGYHNRPDITADSFIPDPFSGKEGSRLYKTGDLVRFRKDSKLEFVGRIDSQVKIRGYRIELGEIENVLAEFDGTEDAIASVLTDKAGNKKLVMHYIPATDKQPSLTELRQYLGNRLPEYMVPASFVQMDEFPLTPNGKIDYQALPEPDNLRPTLETEYVAPSTENEIILADIWRELLNVKQVGINDNFFELGGDSIISIQIISRARQEGLQITPVQIFKNQTIAQLANVAFTAPKIEAEQGFVEGELPLTPIQHWFYNLKFEHPQHWNQSVLLEVNEKLDTDILKDTILALQQHHDALRLEFKTDNGTIIQINRGDTEEVPLEIIDMTSTVETEYIEIIQNESARIQASLNPEQGTIFKVAYFDAAENPGRLLIVIHHLAMDGVSWRILIEDFQLAYAQLKNNQQPVFPAKSTSYKQWAEALTDYANSEILQQQKPYWLNISESGQTILPVDFQDGLNNEFSAQEISVSLTADETDTLLKEVPLVYNTQINDILLTALLLAYSKWTGKRTLTLHMEGHGREHISETIDISRTIGWFTSIYPVILEMGKAVQPGEIIKSVKEQLHKLPQKGIGFGILRYLNTDSTLTTSLSKLDSIPLSFNYLGQFDQALAQESVFSPAQEFRGAERHPDGKRTHFIDITSAVGGVRLAISFAFSTNIFKKVNVQNFANAFISQLRMLIEHCKAPEAGGSTASDFELANLDDKKLEKVMAQLGKKKKRHKK